MPAEHRSLAHYVYQALVHKWTHHRRTTSVYRPTDDGPYRTGVGGDLFPFFAESKGGQSSLSTYAPDKIETVNLANGNLNLHLPLARTLG